MECLSPEESLKRLMDGNEKFVADKLSHKNQNKKRKIEIIAKQSPFAVILGCSDSRVPPEIIFDQGLGDLFVIRVAGNVLDEVIKGSIEYAVGHLKVKLIMILGHSNCGAVAAAVSKKELSVHTKYVTNKISHAVEKARIMPGNIIENAVKINILNVVEKLKETPPVINRLIQKSEIKIIGAYYNLETGKISLLNHN